MTRNRGFTLVELLVVIAIIALLMAILMPVLKRAEGQAENTHCLNNMKHLSLGGIMYADDNDCTFATTAPVLDVEYNRDDQGTRFGLRFSRGFIASLGLVLLAIVIMTVLLAKKTDFDAVKHWLKSIIPRFPKGSL